MTKKEYKKESARLLKIWNYVRSHTDAKVWKKINEACDLELLLEAECGQ